MRRMGRLGAGLLVLVLTLLAISQARADYSDYFPIQGEPILGFKHEPDWANDTPPGLPMSGQRPFRGGPAIGDIDANPANGKEIVIGGRDGRVYAYNQVGGLLWQVDIVPPCADASPGDSKINSVPAIGALYGNGIPYVVVGYGTVLNTPCEGGVVALDGRNGGLAWRYTIPSLGVNDFLDGVVSSPSLADTDGNGTLEVAFGAFDRDVHFLEHNGTLRWKYHAADTVWSSPAFANIDGDATLELIIGTDITANGQVGTENGGYVYAFDTDQFPDGNKIIPFGTGFIWRTFFNATIYSSPAIADIDGDGSLEVIIGSGCFYGNGQWVKILSAATGADLITLPTPSCHKSSPAVGDLDDDGQLEIVAIVQGAARGLDYSEVYAWDHTNPSPKWVRRPFTSFGVGDANADDLGSPLIADLDGNGSLEVILAYDTDVVVLNGQNGAQLTCIGVQGDLSACGPTRSMFTWVGLKQTPAIGDVDNDGDLEVFAAGTYVDATFTPKPFGAIYGWTNFAGLLGSPPGQQAPYSAPWPQFRGNSQHTGLYTRQRLVADQSAIGAVLAPNETRTFWVTFDTGGNTGVAWTLSENDPAGQVSAPANGTGGSKISVPVTIQGAGSPGSYTASITVSTAALGSSSVNITIHTVSTVRRAFIPTIRR